MKAYFHNANEPKNVCCDNCLFANPTDVNGLLECQVDGRSKDADMSCDKFEPLD